jgi:PhzF family phenazine biosynthesis protein
MRRHFITLDVFTSRRFAGNPLAVVLDGEGLEGDSMQAIAREFNLAETVFVLPPQDPAHRARLRIFTPATELPFAGHPTVGTAVLSTASMAAAPANSCSRKASGQFSAQPHRSTPTADMPALSWRGFRKS